MRRKTEKKDGKNRESGEKLRTEYEKQNEAETKN